MAYQSKVNPNHISKNILTERYFDFNKNEANHANLKSKIRNSVKQRFYDFCDARKNQKIVWFLIPLMTLSAAIMPIGFVSMWNFDWYIAYVGISVLMFFGNIIISIADADIRKIIGFYFMTIMFHVISFFGSLIIFGI